MKYYEAGTRRFKLELKDGYWMLVVCDTHGTKFHFRFQSKLAALEEILSYAEIDEERFLI